MDGGHKSVATGLASYRSLRHHHNPQTMRHSKSFMDQHRSELHSSNWRMGRLIAESGVKVFQIETTLNNDTFPPNFAFLQKREWEWSLRDRATFTATSKALDKTPPRIARQIFHSIRSPHALTSVQAGEVEAVCVEPDGRVRAGAPLPGCLLPGSFNPLHHGHRALAEAARGLTGRAPAYELSVVNVDKPPLPDEEVRSRIGQLAWHAPVWLTRQPTFLGKARVGAVYGRVRRVAPVCRGKPIRREPH